MGKKDKQKAAARARSRRWADNKPEDIVIDIESDSGHSADCGYTGGVNYISDSDAEIIVDNAWSESSDNDDTEIHEMEGEELDKNLQALKAAIEWHEGHTTNDTILDKLGKGMSDKVWEKAESN